MGVVMKIEPIDLPAFVGSLSWPIVAGVAIFIFRQPAAELVRLLLRRISKFSFAGFSIELAELSEVKPSFLEVDVRQLDATPMVQSGTDGISGIFAQLQHGGRKGYLVIDLGSEPAPRWLTSRLYLLSFLMTLIDHSICLVFVETVGSVRKRFVGTCPPDSVRWGLARRYPWLESAMAAAYAGVGGAYCAAAGILQVQPTSNFQLDPAFGGLSAMQMNQLMQNFLAYVRGTPVASENSGSEWVALGSGTIEHAKWLDSARVERLFESSFETSAVVLLPNQNIRELRDRILETPGQFVAVVDTDRTFRNLVDRSVLLESLARSFLSQTKSENAGSGKELV